MKLLAKFGLLWYYNGTMKKDIHPSNYRPVIFLDISNDEKFLLDSVVETTETGTWKDGKEYPLYKVEVSSASHPFFTGSEKGVLAKGRVENFKRRVAATTAKNKK
jgi:large subunit ribosomal protein L31